MRGSAGTVMNPERRQSIENDSSCAHCSGRDGRAAQGQERLGRFSVAAGFGVYRKPVGCALDAARHRGADDLVLRRSRPRSNCIAPRHPAIATISHRARLHYGSFCVQQLPSPHMRLVAVTADPAEGEGFTDAGNNLVEQVPMPPDIAEIVGQFVVQHHIDRPFVKRQRD